jgi:phospholipid/cholesterol/gamma-HCH transport system permease protein
MNIQPVQYLVLPRLVAICISLPILVIFAILVGWVGGALVSMLNSSIELSLEAYFNSLRQTVELRDVINGIVKTLIFAVFIGTVSCHQGLVTRGGPRGIGRSVTKAVVNSIVLILILDYFITRALMWFDELFPR